MNFDALAPHYCWMEFLSAGNKLQDCRTTFLDRMRGAKEVLILGEGNGKFLVECRRVLPQAHVTCVDASARMLALAQQRLERHALNSSQVQFVHADVMTWKPAVVYDCIVTHFFLDCFRPEQLELLAFKLAGAAARNARWLLADFRVPDTGLCRWRARLILCVLYLFFRMATRLPANDLTAPDHVLERHGFKLRERRVREWGLLHTDLWERSASSISGVGGCPDC
jgi:SAM-dependent methyltransferase